MPNSGPPCTALPRWARPYVTATDVPPVMLPKAVIDEMAVTALIGTVWVMLARDGIAVIAVIVDMSTDCGVPADAVGVGARIAVSATTALIGTVWSTLPGRKIPTVSATMAFIGSVCVGGDRDGMLVTAAIVFIATACPATGARIAVSAAMVFSGSVWSTNPTRNIAVSAVITDMETDWSPDAAACATPMSQAERCATPMSQARATTR